MVKIVDNIDYIGQWKLVIKFYVNRSTISYALNMKTEIGVWKKEKVQIYEKNQEARTADA